MYELIKELFPFCRSITGDGVRQTLLILKKHIPLITYEVPSGTKAFDWTVPKEWNINDAFIRDIRTGKKIVDFKENNLHVMSYSVPIDTFLILSELQSHLHSLPDQPDAIPYVTSYYEENWGFCLAHNKRLNLHKNRLYRVVINSSLKDGYLTYGELIIPGESEQEIFISTNICHPSMVNNELSGPVVATFIAKWLLNLKPKYTYRFIFIPETIGSILYLSKNLNHLKEKMVAGFVITCIGQNDEYSLIHSRQENTFADKVAQNIIKFYPNHKEYSFLHRACDERQYCCPGVDLPVVALMGTHATKFPEYHTSLDNLDFIKEEEILEGFNLVKDCIELIEKNKTYKLKTICMPHLSRYGLYPTIGSKIRLKETRLIKNFLTYCDGKNDIIDISNIIGVPSKSLYKLIENQKIKSLVTEVN